jgi:hypothetical protein
MTQTMCDICKINEAKDHRYFDSGVIILDGVEIYLYVLEHHRRLQTGVQIDVCDTCFKKILEAFQEKLQCQKTDQTKSG